jgi:hypothetical protein
MASRYLAILLPILLLSGCATRSSGLYRWGDYDKALYEAYKEPEKTTELVLNLENLTTGVEKERLRMPPGLYAELGTLYLQMGELDKALAMYARERDTWPESKGLMDALITNLKRRETASKQPSASDPAPAPLPPPPPRKYRKK